MPLGRSTGPRAPRGPTGPAAPVDAASGGPRRTPRQRCSAGEHLAARRRPTRDGRPDRRARWPARLLGQRAGPGGLAERERSRRARTTAGRAFAPERRLLGSAPTREHHLCSRRPWRALAHQVVGCRRRRRHPSRPSSWAADASRTRRRSFDPSHEMAPHPNAHRSGCRASPGPRGGGARPTRARPARPVPLAGHLSRRGDPSGASGRCCRHPAACPWPSACGPLRAWRSPERGRWRELAQRRAVPWERPCLPYFAAVRGEGVVRASSDPNDDRSAFRCCRSLAAAIAVTSTRGASRRLAQAQSLRAWRGRRRRGLARAARPQRESRCTGAPGMLRTTQNARITASRYCGCFSLVRGLRAQACSEVDGTNERSA